MFVLSGAIAGVGGLLLKLPNAFVMITVGAALILMDGFFACGRARRIGGSLRAGLAVTSSLSRSGLWAPLSSPPI